MESAHAACAKLLGFFVLLIKWITALTPPSSITLSLTAGESPARFPIPQIAWSAIPGLFYNKNWTIKGMILQLTIAYT